MFYDKIFQFYPESQHLIFKNRYLNRLLRGDSTTLPRDEFSDKGIILLNLHK